MRELLKKLCLLDGAPGNESAVSNFIIEQIKDHCDYKVDCMGNVIAYKKGKKTSANKILIDAHTDEVGLIITSVTADGFLKFETLGGIKSYALVSRRVTIGNGITGVIGCKPIHLTKGEEKKKLPKVSDLYIDIGADSKQEALKVVNIGDYAVFQSEYCYLSESIVKSKAIDDRAGCAVLIALLKEESEYDFYATFTVQEELGHRGSEVATFSVDPQFGICLEATTAADLSGVAEESKVCVQGNGPAVSFMDRSTLYDRELYNEALSCGVICQPKAAVAGGNNAGAIHLSRGGVRTMAISLPCRYIHTASCVADLNDFDKMKDLTKVMVEKIGSGKIN